MKPGPFAIAMSAVALLFLAAASITRAQSEESRKHFLHELGGPFFVSRDKVQDDLKLSDDQKQKLRDQLSADVEEARTVGNLKPEERGPAMQALRRASSAKLETFLLEILTADQLQRFQQLKLQYDTPAIMVQPEIAKALNITDDQRKQFMGVIQEMKKEIDPLMKAAKSGGNPQEILAKVTRLRQDAQGRIEAMLSEAQKKHWKEMTGPPLVIW